MNKKILPLIVLSLGGAFLSSCVNLKPVVSESRSYALGPIEIQKAEDKRPISEAIFITRPHVPSYIDSRRLVYRAAGGEVREMASARWAEPMVEGVARATSLYLNQVIGHETVVGYYPWPNDNAEASQLALEFMRFSATEAGEVQVAVRWTLKRSTGEIKSKLLSIEDLEWKVAEPASLVAAYNSALRALAIDVINSLD